MGGVGRAGPLSLHAPAVGLASVGGPVSQRQGRPEGWPQAQDTTALAATTLLPVAALVQAADLRAGSRWRLRLARVGLLLRPATWSAARPAAPPTERPAAPGQQVLP